MSSWDIVLVTVGTQFLARRPVWDTVIGTQPSLHQFDLHSSASASGRPILKGQTGNRLEVLPVASGQRGVVVQSDGGNREIHLAETGMLLLQVQVQRDSFPRERQDADNTRGLSNLVQAGIRASQLFGSSGFLGSGV